MTATTDQTRERPNRRWLWLAAIVVLAGIAVALWQRGWSRPQQTGGPPPAISVTVAQPERRDVPIYLSAPGTVQAWNTVAVRSQIDGKLMSVNFVEGQEVRQGDILAQIDPSALKATLDQATAKKAEDDAQLAAAEKDLERYRALLQRQVAPQQTVDQQQAKVEQLRATVNADQAAIESARVQLGYATITAPIDGRAGLRQLDPGNIIHPGDSNPLTLLTTIRPSTIIFTLPQKSLFDVREAMLRGPVTTSAWDQDDKRELAQGQLLFLDNQIDQQTGTVRLKARFANEDERLWPGEFVRIRTLVDIRKDALTIPSAALQRGAQGFYVWVLQPNNVVDARSIDATPIDDRIAIVANGLSPDERIVVNGQNRLDAGTRVEPHSQQAGNAPS
jgi:multidrug efflux system membrane fusion protein